MRKLSSFVLVAVSLLGSNLKAQQLSQASVAPQRDPQALALLGQCASAMGATGIVPDLYLEGTISSKNADKPPSTVVLKSKGTGQLRTEFTSSGIQQVFVVSNERGFSLASGKKQNLALQATAYFRPEHLSGFACTIDAARPNIAISYGGLETVGASTAHHIVFRAQSSDPLDILMSEFHLYLDSTTFRVVKTVTWAFSPQTLDNRSTWETYYDNYQSVSGVLVPLRITHLLAGSEFDQWTFTTIRTDVPVSNADFE